MIISTPIFDDFENEDRNILMIRPLDRLNQLYYQSRRRVRLVHPAACGLRP